MSHTAGEKNHIADGKDPGIRASVVDNGDGTASLKVKSADAPDTYSIVTGAVAGVDQAVTVTSRGFQGLYFTTSGTSTLSYVIESSNDNVTWSDRTSISTGLSGVAFLTSPVSTVGASNGLVAINTWGAPYFRIRCTAYTSGTLNVEAVPVVSAIPFKILSAISGPVVAQIQGYTGSAFVNAYVNPASADGAGNTINGLWTNSRLHGLNGSGSWDRIRGDVTNGLDVDVTRQATYCGKTITYVNVSQGAAGTTQLAAANGTMKNKLMGGVISLDANGTIAFTDGTVSTGAIPVLASQPLNIARDLIPFWETAAVNRALSITTTGGKAFGTVSILVEA